MAVVAVALATVSVTVAAFSTACCIVVRRFVMRDDDDDPPPTTRPHPTQRVSRV